MLRATVVAIVIGGALLPGTAAFADGGSLIEFRGGDGGHFLPGDPANGTSFISIPESRQELLDRGPFYTYLVPNGGFIREGRALPPGTIRLGTATIVPEGTRNVFEVRMPFTVPDVPGGYYMVQFCNDPCTIAGFREGLWGEISIVATEREAELLNETARLDGELWSAKRRLRKAMKDDEELLARVEAAAADASENLELRSRVADLEAQLSETQGLAGRPSSPTASDDRPLADAWALFGIALAVVAALLAFALALVFSGRNGPRVVVPDTIAELERDDESVALR